MDFSPPSYRAPIPSSRRQTAPCRVMVIDDDESARVQMTALLSASGMEVSWLSSPIGATRKIIEDNIEVLVLELTMPSMRGDKLASLLRKNPRLQNLAVVLLSGGASDSLLDLVEVDVDAVVLKSAIDTELLAAVSRARQARRLSFAVSPR